MNHLIKKIAILAVIITVVVSLYFGAYLPYKKAKSFISAMHSLQSVNGISDLKNKLDNVLEINSPVARDETRSFVLDQLSNILRGDLPEEVGQSIVGYAEEISAPVLEDSRSPELTKIILKVGVIYQRAWLIYKNPVYAERTEDMYLAGLEVSPNRPQFLYGLFDLYLSAGRVEDAVAVGDKIIALWPTDSTFRERLQLLTASQ